QRTTRTLSSFAALLRMSARVVYMADVIAFFFAGRFSSTRRMLPERSVLMSLIVCSFVRYSSGSSSRRPVPSFSVRRRLRGGHRCPERQNPDHGGPPRCARRARGRGGLVLW